MYNVNIYLYVNMSLFSCVGISFMQYLTSLCTTTDIYVHMYNMLCDQFQEVEVKRRLSQDEQSVSHLGNHKSLTLTHKYLQMCVCNKREVCRRELRICDSLIFELTLKIYKISYKFSSDFFKRYGNIAKNISH